MMSEDDDYENAGRHDREPEDALLNLLAVIHRDGGHHTEAVGLHQSTWDAMKLVPDLYMKIDDLTRELERLSGAPESLP